ncbi:MAG TPA: response regulator transcription factor [Nocardioidaceae bacterium]|nr:response regulator transcription factor [Nocardioidaceae bacterium]
MTSVLVVDDQELVRTGFALILEKAGLEVVGMAGDGLEAVDLARATEPDVVLMDIRMPRLDGIEATRRVVADRPDTRVVALTTFDLDEYVYAAINAGASGFLLKDVAPADLVYAVRLVARGESILAPALTRRLLERFARVPADDPRAARLTERERSVLVQVAHGQANADIARELFLSEATIKTYVSRLLSKLDLRDRVQLAVFAYESGLVRAGDTRGQ